MIVFAVGAAILLGLAAAIAHKLKKSDPYGLKETRRDAAEKARK